MGKVAVGGYELSKRETRIDIRLHQGIVCIKKGVDFRLGHTDFGSARNLFSQYAADSDAAQSSCVPRQPATGLPPDRERPADLGRDPKDDLIDLLAGKDVPQGFYVESTCNCLCDF
jgi:hypothetical protein